MVLLQILKRKDASSLIVAIVLAFVLANLLPTLTSEIAANISGLIDNENSSSYSAMTSAFKGQYFYAITWAALQVAALEVMLWLYVVTKSYAKKK